MHMYVHQRSAAMILGNDEATDPFMDVDGDFGIEIEEDETIIDDE